MSSITQHHTNPDISATATYENGKSSASLTFTVDGVSMRVKREFETFEKAEHWRKSILGLLKEVSLVVERTPQAKQARLIATLSQEFSAFRFEPGSNPDYPDALVIVCPDGISYERAEWFRERINARVKELTGEG